MHRDRDAVADHLRDQAIDNLDTEGMLTAITDGLIAAATDDADPVDHPNSIYDATPGQQHALTLMGRAIKEYLSHSRIDDSAVDSWIDAYHAGAFSEWDAA